VAFNQRDQAIILLVQQSYWGRLFLQVVLSIPPTLPPHPFPRHVFPLAQLFIDSPALNHASRYQQEIRPYGQMTNTYIPDNRSVMSKTGASGREDTYVAVPLMTDHSGCLVLSKSA